MDGKSKKSKKRAQKTIDSDDTNTKPSCSTVSDADNKASRPTTQPQAEDTDSRESHSEEFQQVEPRRKKRMCKTSSSAALCDALTDPKDILEKYWPQRHFLFKRYDEGILLDRESWYSVTQEDTAAEIAEKCKCDVIVDGFCGAGGNTIQFAKTCKKVVAVDIEEKKLRLAKNNANVYGVAENIEFVCGDFLKLAPKLKADVVFLSPPWGGPEYLEADVFDIDKMDKLNIMAAARQITPNIAFFLPRNADRTKVKALTNVSGQPEIVEHCVETKAKPGTMEKSRKKVKAITAYFGDLANN